MSLRSILGGSGRVKKKTRPKSNTSPSPSWASTLPRRKPATTTKRAKSKDENDHVDFFGDDKLDDLGLVHALATDLNLRDTPQAIQYVRKHMFSPVPNVAAGMKSTRIAEILNYRRNLPPLVSLSHVQALLSSPSAVEREVAELSHRGFLRRIAVPRRGAIGEFVVLAEEYAALITGTKTLSEGAKEALLGFLERNPSTQVLGPDSGLQLDRLLELVRAGFLTAHHVGGVVTYSSGSERVMGQYARPEDRSTLTSLETVSRHAAGSLGTVGGAGAVHNVGGSGGRSGPSSSLAGSFPDVATTEYRLAVPGSGSFLKLVSGALDHFVSLLGKSRFREAPETVLRERWDGGIARLDGGGGGGGGGEDSIQHYEKYVVGKRARGEFFGVLPGQTRKWRQFYGLGFEWVLQEAVGAGLVEVFETGSVGRGVRVI
ncbi:serine-threonine protein kinase 19-domain-containing protein [Xylariaceae sp. FL0255]|nr:serine-threonine protein kinase 19-domain-containing protein [Xylariaceae sp. FL0255]